MKLQMCSIWRWAAVPALIFTLASAAMAQTLVQKTENPKRFGKTFWVSVAALGASSFADAYSSRGRVERNPLLQNSDGRFSVGKAAMIKVGMAVGLISIEGWMMKRHPGPGVERFATFTNFVAAGAFAGTAAYNSRSRASGSSAPVYLTQ